MMSFLKKLSVAGVCVLSCCLSMAQFPLGENVRAARAEIKNILKKGGYHFLEEHQLGKDLFVIAYAEEFRVTLDLNDYKNVEAINIIAKKTSTFLKLQKTFSFSDWTYIGDIKNQLNETESLYHFRDYKIRMDVKSRQFVVALLHND